MRIVPRVSAMSTASRLSRPCIIDDKKATEKQSTPNCLHAGLHWAYPFGHGRSAHDSVKPLSQLKGNKKHATHRLHQIHKCGSVDLLQGSPSILPQEGKYHQSDHHKGF